MFVGFSGVGVTSGLFVGVSGEGVLFVGDSGEGFCVELLFQFSVEETGGSGDVFVELFCTLFDGHSVIDPAPGLPHCPPPSDPVQLPTPRVVNVASFELEILPDASVVMME